MSRAHHLAAAGVLLTALLLSACGPTHLRPNAPGNIDLRARPKPIDKQEVEEPDDPGEHRLALTYGALAGGGFSVRNGGDVGGGAALTLEVSVHYGQSRGSHSAEDSSWIVPVYPMPALGLNLGYQSIAPTGDVDLTVVRPFYLELQYSDLYWVAAGWQVDFDQGRSGPQLTTGLGPLYLRCAHILDTETQLEIGLVLKGWHVWVWSR